MASSKISHKWNLVCSLSLRKIYLRFIHVFVQINSSFLFMAKCPLHGCTTVYLSIHWLKGILIISMFLVIMNKAPKNIFVQDFMWTQTFISLGYVSGSAIVELYSKCMLNFIRNWQTALQNDWTTLYSHQQCLRTQSVPHFQYSLLSAFLSYNNKCVVISHWIFNLHFLHD